MKIKRFPLPLILGSMLATACSSASHHSHDGAVRQENAGKAVVQIMDTNGDGQISWQENQQYFDKLFTRLDVNHDGYISAEEFNAINNDPLFKAMPLQKLGVSFVMFDRNDDGKLSHDEFEHMGDRVFTLLDRNMDGQISAGDFSQEACSSDSSEGHSGGGGHGRHGGGMGY